MPTPTTPDHGARFQFVLVSADGPKADYALTVFLPRGEALVLEAAVSADGVSCSGAVEALEAQPNAAWLNKQIQVIVRGMAKSSAWPRRVTRWKAEA